jgi:prepilin-type N-terminal cleavage/methylation domain-containing protein
MMKRSNSGFTLVEMLTVIGMLGILMATAATGISRARTQARIAKAHAEVRQLIGAWMAYEAAYDGWPMELPSGGTAIEATQSTLKELLGEGENKVVFLNAQMKGGAFRDPWGMPYKIRFSPSTQDAVEETFSTAISFPNRNRPKLE